jgi:hypothetical protein
MWIGWMDSHRAARYSKQRGGTNTDCATNTDRMTLRTAASIYKELTIGIRGLLYDAVHVADPYIGNNKRLIGRRRYCLSLTCASLCLYARRNTNHSITLHNQRTRDIIDGLQVPST